MFVAKKDLVSVCMCGICVSLASLLPESASVGLYQVSRQTVHLSDGRFAGKDDDDDDDDDDNGNDCGGGGGDDDGDHDCCGWSDVSRSFRDRFFASGR